MKNKKNGEPVDKHCKEICLNEETKREACIDVKYQERLNLSALHSELTNGNNLFRYKELCDILTEPEKKPGNSRIYQIAYWQNYMDIVAEGRKWRINEVYDEPLISLYTNNKSEFYDTNMYIILSLLLEKKQELNFSSEDFSTVLLSKTALAQQLGFINLKFRGFFGNPDKLAEIKHMNEKDVRQFFNRTLNSYSSIIESTLKNMERQGFIIADIVTSGYDENNVYRPLSNMEKESVLNLTNLTFEHLAPDHLLKVSPNKNKTFWGEKPADEYIDCDIFSIQDVFKYHISDQFMSFRNDLIKQKLNLSFVSKAYQITLNTSCENVKNFLAKKIDTFYPDTSPLEHNNSLYVEQRKKYYDDYLQKCIDKETDSSVKKRLIDSKNLDVKTNSQLIDYLIKLKPTIEHDDDDDIDNDINNR